MDEETLWTGRPSQVANLMFFMVNILFIWLVLPIFFIIGRFLSTRFTNYELTSNRLITKSGVLKRHHDEVELYRIRDYKITQPFFLRLFGLSHLDIYTADKTQDKLVLRAIKDAEKVRRIMRENVERRRIETKTRDVEFS